jgi:type IV secretion system protein VirB11
MRAIETLAEMNRSREAATPLLAEDVSVRQFLIPIQHLLDRDEVTEVCINAPGEAFVETAAGWTRVPAREMTYPRCMALAQAIATLLNQRIGQETPLLSGDLSTQERIQIVIPPAVRGGASITIRKPSATAYTLQELASQGLFSRVREASHDLQPVQRELLHLKAERRFEEFLRLAVASRQTIVAAGETGTGKTTFMKALVHEIAPEERIITIEDAHELRMPDRENKVHLLYAKGGQGAARVTAQDLLASCMRMRPDRIFLAELRGAETFEFLNLGLSGHAGSMTSVHASSCAAALKRMAMLAMQSPEGRSLPYAEVESLLLAVIDVIVHITRPADRRGRFVDEIYYDPLAGIAGARALGT